MKLIATFIAALSILIQFSAQSLAAPDQAQEKVNRVLLRKVTFGNQLVSERLAPWHQTMDRQLELLIRDAAAGGIQDASVYLEVVSEQATQLLHDAEMYLGAHHVQALEAAMIGASSGFVQEAEAAIATRHALWNTEIVPMAQLWKASPTDKPTLAAFDPAAARLVSALLNQTSLLEEVGLQKDKLEYFLTDESRHIWDKVRNGQSGTRLFSPSYRKAMSDIMEEYLVTARYFNAERPLQQAALRYEAEDRQSSLLLLYAFVKLINQSNPHALEEGYALLEKAFEKQQTARIAFNLVRVGTRLKRVDDTMLWKLIDHQNYVGDEEGLAELYNLAMVRFLRDDQLDEAVRLYNLAAQQGIAEEIPARFRFILLVRSGEYGRLSAEARGLDLNAIFATRAEQVARNR